MSCKDNVHVNALVFVTAKAICLHDAKKVACGKHKQDAITADSTAMAVLTLWQDDIGTINLDRSYSFTNHLENAFQGKNSLCVPKDAELHWLMTLLMSNRNRLTVIQTPTLSIGMVWRLLVYPSSHHILPASHAKPRSR